MRLLVKGERPIRRCYAFHYQACRAWRVVLALLLWTEEGGWGCFRRRLSTGPNENGDEVRRFSFLCQRTSGGDGLEACPRWDSEVFARVPLSVPEGFSADGDAVDATINESSASMFGRGGGEDAR